jgi:hypothetical protein
LTVVYHLFNLFEIGEYVTEQANDKKELGKIVGIVDEEVYKVETESADTGYFSEEAVKEAEKREEPP